VVTVEPALVPDQVLVPEPARVALAQVELAEPVLAAEQVEPAVAPVVLAVAALEAAPGAEGVAPNSRDEKESPALAGLSLAGAHVRPLLYTRLSIRTRWRGAA
jgi:hypothetical protein